MEFEFTNVQGQRKTLEAESLMPPENFMKLLDEKGEIKFLVNPNAVAFVEAKKSESKIEVLK